ncbi:hypothetical protein BGZ74_009835 [Mortierella antarctica]|nr:hypothetical protein BGZ74_009835 [Mortierella antarctica]
MEPQATRYYLPPEFCATTTKNIVQVLHDIYAEHSSTAAHEPLIVVISTTGVSDVCKDVPFGFQTMYHIALVDPHKDKKEMEKMIIENITRADAVFRGGLSTGDQNVKGGKGWRKLKTDVGAWVFEETIKTDGQRRLGQCVTLTN